MLDCNLWVFQDLQYPLDVSYSFDYAKASKTMNTIEATSALDVIWCLASDPAEAVWDTLCWSDSVPVMKSINVNGLFKSFQIGVENFEADQQFCLIGYSFDVDFS